MTLRRAAFAIPGDLSTPTGGYIYERRLLEGLRAQGRDMRYLKLGPSFPDATPKDMADAIAQLASLEPDRAVILDGFISATLETRALAALHVPSLAMVHHPLALESGLDQARRDHLYRLERANLAHVSHVLVPSPATAAMLVASYGVTAERITIARPGTDRPTHPRAPVSPPLILSVGIQHPRKGHDILLKALARLTHLEWTAVIAGKVYDADHAEELARLHRDLGLSGRVRLAGYVSDADLAALYASASVFALATRYEGYGLVFDEALVNGLPIVSCQTGAVPDTVPADAGRLVPTDDAQAFADALAGLLESETTYARCAQAARAAGQTLPDWADTAETVGRVIDRI
ncbi:Glycosyl transferase, group 1 [Roseibacterium elongatum DSM 19469]|uniref:Glycosyl transferase, group 1 n=1 Tax=Roseicyclus elongatus DSM 19469 TaxID=1294273 RepID=W8SKF3_9RHOB|nr:glycosyltransferase family 4 protein [Roseibacterium elongatum]AHM02985.1 Glycosyl transferase, group 1 [Roseibacterium elongatum DSM 19469]